MSLVIARRKRFWLNLSIACLLLTAAAVSAVSARDPDSVGLRVGMILMTVGAAMWLNWRILLPLTVVFWLAPNSIRASLAEEATFTTNALLELPGLIGLAVSAALVHFNLHRLEDEDVLIGTVTDDLGTDRDTGVYDERLLRASLEAELTRARRFGRSFALVLVGVDELYQKFDYRGRDEWQCAFSATAQLLRSTRIHIDRVHRYGATGFALLLPESGPREVKGLVRRLNRLAKTMLPPQGEPGGPLPVHFGATFFPDAATTVEALLKRAEIATRLAEKNPTRLQLDGAAAPEPPPPETLRRGQRKAAAAEAVPAEMSPLDATAHATVASVAEAESLVATSLDGAVVDLLGHLDDTLNLIETLKATATVRNAWKKPPRHDRPPPDNLSQDLALTRLSPLDTLLAGTYGRA